MSKFICKDCGREFEEEDMRTFDFHGEDVMVCEDCFCEKYTVCENCENVVLNSEICRIDTWEHGLMYICENCNEYYSNCECCGRECETEEMTYINNDEEYVCPHCYENEYIECEDCGEIFHNRDIVEVGSGITRQICCNCNEDNDCVLGYHDNENWDTKYDLGENPKYYIGFENETGNNFSNENERDVAKYLKERLNVRLERDSSIDSCSDIEIISFPQSYDYIMANKEKLKECFEYMVSKNYRSSDLGTCGLHFHFTRLDNSEETSARLWSILEQWKDFIESIGGRRSGRYYEWASNYTSQISEEDYKSTEEIKSKFRMQATRYLAINIMNSKTIEMRFCKGTLNFKTFMARLQFVNNLYSVAINHELPINKIELKDLVKGEYIEEYVANNYKYNIPLLEDKNKEIISKKAKQNRLIEQLRKEINNYIKKEFEFMNKEIPKLLKENTQYNKNRKIIEITEYMYENIKLFQMIKYSSFCFNEIYCFIKDEVIHKKYCSNEDLNNKHKEYVLENIMKIYEKMKEAK